MGKLIAAAYPPFIRRGEFGLEAALIQALETYGSIGMAEDFLNYGNSALGDAAGKWGRRHR